MVALTCVVYNRQGAADPEHRSVRTINKRVFIGASVALPPRQRTKNAHFEPTAESQSPSAGVLANLRKRNARWPVSTVLRSLATPTLATGYSDQEAHPHGDR